MASSTSAQSRDPDKSPQQVLVVHAGYEGFVLSVVAIMLVNSVLIVLPVPGEMRSVAWVVNSLLSVFLIIDAIWRFVRPAGRLRWLFKGWGWLILLGSLPIPFATAGRLLAMWLVVRRMRRQDLASIGVNIVRKRAQSTLLGVLLVAILVFEVSGILILQAESTSPDANIRNVYDALWWGYVTMATVGYGDRYPVTTNGRLVGIAVMTIGVALFSVITSFLADWFRRPRVVNTHPLSAGKPTGDVPMLIAAMRQAIDEKAHADQLALDELRARLDQIERQLK
ncbi:MAG: ion channel [Caldilinea sp.]